MILPPGGFLTLGAILLGFAWWEERHTPARQGVRQWFHGVDPGSVPGTAVAGAGTGGLRAPEEGGAD